MSAIIVLFPPQKELLGRCLLQANPNQVLHILDFEQAGRKPEKAIAHVGCHIIFDGICRKAKSVLMPSASPHSPLHLDERHGRAVVVVRSPFSQGAEVKFLFECRTIAGLP